MSLRIFSDYILKMSISRFTTNIVTEITYSLFLNPVPRHNIGPLPFTSWPKFLKRRIIDFAIEVSVG